jgi:PKD repeat protein
MKKIFTTLLLSTSAFVFGQTQIANAGFENWDNVGSGTEEPTSFNSNKTGTGLASSGPQTCSRATSPHSGTYCARVETKYYIFAVVNGNVTSGVVEAPSTNKAEGFLSATAANSARIAFTGRPDSLVGWYKYTQATSGTGATAEQGKVRVILHTGDYYDPETPVASNHPNMSANKVGDALFVSPAANQATWKRFSVPFAYAVGTAPAYVMVNVTSSNNQLTVAPGSSGTGSIMFLDDLEMIYNPVANFTSPSTICAGTAATFTDQSTATPTAWAWSFPGATPTTSSAQNPSITYTTGGTYSVTLVSTYATGTVAVTKTVSVNAAPNVSVNSPTICAGASATLTASGATSYVWNTTATTASISVSPAATTMYTVTGTDAAGCTAKQIATVSISASNLNVNAATICSGGTVALIVSGANTYTWTTPASNSATITVSPTVTTNYNVSGTNALGCVHSVTTSVTITSAPTISVNSATICSGKSATLTASGVSSYTWTSPASNSAVITVTPSSTTVYTVSGSAAGCVGTFSTTGSVLVNPTPVVSLTAISSTPCVGASAIALSGSPSGGVYSGTGVSSGSFTPSTAGTFTVTYTFTNTSGCSASDSKPITVDACTGVKELELTGVQVYPNPVSDVLYINTKNTNLKTVEVYDMTGKQVMAVTTSESLISLSSNALTNGIYLVKIQSENAKPVITRFIKN